MTGQIHSQELACIYSAAILADDDIPVTADKMTTLIKAAGVNVEPVWPSLYAKALKTVDIKQLITRVGSAPTGQSVGGGTGGSLSEGDAKLADSKTAAEEAAAAAEEETDDDDDMGLSLFD